MPLARGGGGQGNRGCDRADRPRGRVRDRPAQGDGHPRRHRGRAGLRRGRDHGGRRADRGRPLEHGRVQGPAVAPQPRALRQRRHVRRRGPGRARARGALHERAGDRRSSAGRAAGAAVEAGRHGGATRGSPAPAGPGGATGRAGRDPPPLETALAKTAANLAAKFVCDEAMQIHGGYGYSREYPLERAYRDIRGLCFGAGTVEAQRNFIGLRVAAGGATGSPGWVDPLAELPERPTRPTASRRRPVSRRYSDRRGHPGPTLGDRRLIADRPSVAQDGSEVDHVPGAVATRSWTRCRRTGSGPRAGRYSGIRDFEISDPVGAHAGGIQWPYAGAQRRTRAWPADGRAEQGVRRLDVEPEVGHQAVLPVVRRVGDPRLELDVGGARKERRQCRGDRALDHALPQGVHLRLELRRGGRRELRRLR